MCEAIRFYAGCYHSQEIELKISQQSWKLTFSGESGSIYLLLILYVTMVDFVENAVHTVFFTLFVLFWCMNIIVMCINQWRYHHAKVTTHSSATSRDVCARVKTGSVSSKRTLSSMSSPHGCSTGETCGG